MSQTQMSLPRSYELPACKHTVQFYYSDKYLTSTVTRFLTNGFRNGNGMVVIATAEHLKAFREELRAQGFDVQEALDTKQFQEFDAHDTLAEFLIDGNLDSQRFGLTVGKILQNSLNSFSRLPLLAYGEMVDVASRQGNHAAAIHLEEMWNDLGAIYSFELLCAYSMNGFYKETHNHDFGRICRTHSSVAGTELLFDVDENERALQICLLEQRALALEAEIQHRKETENALLHALIEQKQSDERFRAADRELRCFLDNAAEGLHRIGRDGEILWANQSQLDLLGYTADEYIGRNIADFHADAEVIPDILGRLKQHETLKNYEARLRAKDGSIRHVLINSNVMFEEEGVLHAQCFTRDVTELKKAENIESFLSAIVECADDAVVSKTLDGIILSWNPAAERLFGYSAKEVVGKSISILIPPDRPDEEARILERLCRGERIDHFETQRIRKDGSLVDISITVSPIRNRNGLIIGASKIARDITERKRIEFERNELLWREQVARAQAEAASRLKDEFLAVLSHELRTPLNAIIGWASILGSRDEKELIRRAVEIIQRNALMQKRLIEDLLDMSRILSGELVIKLERVNLSEVANAAFDSIRPAAIAKSIRVDLLIDHALSVTGDPDRLQQVIWNLLSNSIKFTPTGGQVTVLVQRYGAYVEIKVIDNGEGIVAEFLPFVFDRFRQAEQGITRQHGGLGLGLALVKDLVELHGGTLSATSSGAAKGSTFTVCLPFLADPS